MGTSDILFECEIALNEELTAGFYGNDEDPIRQAIENLLRHINTVRMLPGLDQPPYEEWHLAGVTKSTPTDGDREWDEPGDFDKERDEVDRIRDHCDEGNEDDPFDRGNRSDNRVNDAANRHTTGRTAGTNLEDAGDE